MRIIEKYILKAKGKALERIQRALVTRYAQIYPGWEIYYISIEKSQDRNEQIDQVIEFLNRLKEKEAP